METLKRVWPVKHHNLGELVVVVLCFSIMVFSISVFVYRGVLRGLDGVNPQTPGLDFHCFYAAGQLWNEGSDPYDYDEYRARFNQLTGQEMPFPYFYPPQATILFSLLAILPFKTAYLVLLGIHLSLLVLSLCMLAFILSWYRPIGLLEVTLLISFVGTGFGRINVREGQTGLLACALLLATFILARYGRNALAGLSLAAVTFKPTFVPLYVGYYLLRRSYRLVAVCVLAAGLFTILPLLLTQRPPVETMMNWLHVLRLGDAPDTVNDPSPFAPYSATMHDLRPLVYRIFNAQSNVTTAISWLIILILVGSTAYLIWHSQPSKKGDLLDFGLVSALSLLSIYHRPYDDFLLFSGLVYLYVHAVKISDKAARRNWGVFLVIVILLITLPTDISARLSYTYPVLQDNYLWRVIAPFPTWAGIAVLSTLLWLKARQLAPRERQANL